MRLPFPIRLETQRPSGLIMSFLTFARLTRFASSQVRELPLKASGAEFLNLSVSFAWTHPLVHNDCGPRLLL